MGGSWDDSWAVDAHPGCATSFQVAFGGTPNLIQQWPTVSWNWAEIVEWIFWTHPFLKDYH
uniref:Uncharacterized protein n=1 Tax=Physcomitrium patens TaxID=3218 RepID=A0A2K1LBJ5_PHYPA|nr:hypothetical protein PHYPA_001822 [Physcomitrium patens]